MILCHLSFVLTTLQVKTVHDYRQQVGELLGRAALALKHKDAEKTFYNLKCLDGEEWTKLLILPPEFERKCRLVYKSVPKTPLVQLLSQSQHLITYNTMEDEEHPAGSSCVTSQVEKCMRMLILSSKSNVAGWSGGSHLLRLLLPRLRKL